MATGCGKASSSKSPRELAAILRANGHDVKAESLTVEQRYADSKRSPDDKGTTYVVRAEVRYEIFVANSDGWTEVKRAPPPQEQGIAEAQLSSFADAVQRYRMDN